MIAIMSTLTTHPALLGKAKNLPAGCTRACGARSNITLFRSLHRFAFMLATLVFAGVIGAVLGDALSWTTAVTAVVMSSLGFVALVSAIAQREGEKIEAAQAIADQNTAALAAYEAAVYRRNKNKSLSKKEKRLLASGPTLVCPLGKIEHTEP